MALHSLTGPDQPLADAQALADWLEALFEPEALSVSVVERDEDKGLWRAEALYDNFPDAEALTARARGAELHIGRIDCAEVAQTNWVEESLRGLAPVRAGRFLIHGSHDRARAPMHGIALEIDAGTAFGTGHHGTTAGCLEAYDRLARRKLPRRVLDIGCGTGVLAIAAARLSRLPVVASDIDPEAVRVSEANARANGCGGLVRTAVAAGTDAALIRKGAPYDLIFANILARPLVVLAPALARLTAGGGHVILSGLTAAQERWVRASYRNAGFVLDGRIRHDNWMTLVMRYAG